MPFKHHYHTFAGVRMPLRGNHLESLQMAQCPVTIDTLIALAQPDAQPVIAYSLRAGTAVLEAGSKEQKWKLPTELVSKAQRAQSEAVKTLVQTYGPLCCVLCSFESSGRQPSREEADRNEARLGFRTPSQFIQVVCAETGGCAGLRCPVCLLSLSHTGSLFCVQGRAARLCGAGSTPPTSSACS